MCYGLAMTRRLALLRAAWIAPLALIGCNQILGIQPGTDTSSASGSGSTSAATTTGDTSSTSTSSTTSASSTSSTGGMGGSGGSGGSGTGGSGGSINMLLAAQGGPGDVPDPSMPFEKHTVTITRRAGHDHIVISAKTDGTGPLYVDDNVHIVVTPTVGNMKDQYYEFWNGFPCPAASTTVPPLGDGSGDSPPIDVTFLFDPDTTKPQQVTLEFWHCASHIPAAHSDFYLVEL